MKLFQAIKPLFPALILSATTSFMFFIFEPITLYLNNYEDFWFDLYDMLPILLGTFIGISIALFLSLTLVYVFLTKLIKKPNLYYYFLAIIFCIFIITYIQGNFLSNNLPTLVGAPFNWRGYPLESIISVSLWFIAFFILYVSLQKFGALKFNKIIPWITGAVFIMLSISLVTTIATSGSAFEDKNTTVATFDHYNDASSDRNFFILLVDAVDSQYFGNIVESNPEYQDLFKDFTYYPDTLSVYPFTDYSIPQILTQTISYNETNITEHSKAAFKNSDLFKKLHDDGYQMSYYHNDASVNVAMDAETANSFKNISQIANIDTQKFIFEIIRYDLFRYLPYPLKGKVHIENSDFSSSIPNNSSSNFNEDNLLNYNIYLEQPINVINNKVFQFIHLEGGHIPFNLDENLNRTDGTGTYEQKLTAVLKVIQAYLERLKTAGIYNDSAIIIMSDHGFYPDDLRGSSFPDLTKRINPILYIKGIDESHSKLIKSDKPISFTDLGSAYNDLLQGKSSTELFKDISYPRTRKILVYNNIAYLFEYETSGPAWDASQMQPTGQEYFLESD